MKIPDKLRVLGHRYCVIKKKTISDMKGTAGTFCANTMEISIESRFKKSKMAEAFLHEILEAAKYHLNLDISHQDLSGISEFMYQVIHDNKLRF